jgi:uncharacterized protein YqgV (UPF0045/DUF77 family)
MITFSEFSKKQANNKLPLREKFFRGMIFNVGQIVEDTEGTYEILDRGTNYITVTDSSGNLSKKFIDDVTLSEDANIPYHVADAHFSFKGFTPSKAFQSNEQAVSAFKNTVERYEAGRIKDAVAIIKALKAVDCFLTLAYKSIEKNTPAEMTTMQGCIDTATNSLSRIGEYLHHEEYLNSMAELIGVHNAKNKPMDESMEVIKQTDKLKVAAVIADTLGADSNGTNAETMVNNALRTARKNAMMTKGESLKIIQRMLELAKQVGIKYDENIIKTVTEEKLEELSLDTLRKAASAKHSTPVKTINHAIKRLQSGERTQDKLHTAELKRIADNSTKKMNEARVGDYVTCDHSSGKKVYGKVKAVHGGVYEVSHKNGKIGFYHNHKVMLNEVEPIEESKVVTFDDLSKKLKDKHYNMGKPEIEKPEEHTKQGHSLKHSSDAHRHQLVRKLRDI